jgi:hypothetical protein
MLEGQYNRPDLKELFCYYASYWCLMIIWLAAGYCGVPQIMQVESTAFFAIHTWLFGLISLLQSLQVMVCHAGIITFKPMNTTMKLSYMVLLSICLLNAYDGEYISNVPLCIALLTAVVLILVVMWIASVTNEMTAILGIKIFTIKPKSSFQMTATSRDLPGSGDFRPFADEE